LRYTRVQPFWAKAEQIASSRKTAKVCAPLVVKVPL